MEYVVIYEQVKDNWSAYSPDVPGCVAAADTLDELRSLFAEALEFHLEGLREAGEPLPEPTVIAEKVTVPI